MSERLMAQLDGARFCKYDTSGLLLAWFGGHGVHVYDAAGVERDFFSCGDQALTNADQPDVEAAMADYINGNADPELRHQRVEQN